MYIEFLGRFVAYIFTGYTKFQSMFNLLSILLPTLLFTLAYGINCHVGSNTTSTIQSSAKYAPFKTCQIITQKCPYSLPGNLCQGQISVTNVLPVDTIKFYSGSPADCDVVRRSYAGVEWPIFGFICCDSEMCNVPFGANDTVFDESAVRAGNFNATGFPKLIPEQKKKKLNTLDDITSKEWMQKTAILVTVAAIVLSSLI